MGNGYEYGSYNNYTDQLEEILEELPTDMLGLILAVLLGVLIVWLAIVILVYLFMAIGLYRMGKNRGMTNAYLAFIPVADIYYLGALRDRINAANGKKTNYRVKLLTVYLVHFGCIFFESLFQGMAMASNMTAFMALTTIFSLASTGFMITYIVFYYIALYTVFKEYSPNHAVVFLVLSILFGITTPFFIFAIRNKVGTSQRPKYYYQQPPYYPQQYQ